MVCAIHKIKEIIGNKKPLNFLSGLGKADAPIGIYK